MSITVFLGAPGSGKGTQAKKLTDELAIQQFSTGDMLRQQMSLGTPLGLKAKSYIEKGALVPDGIMIELIESSLSALPASCQQVILDGFPRTVPQAEALDLKPQTTPKVAIYFDVAETVLLKRLTGRRVCPACGDSYHLEFIPPAKAGVCNKCGTALIQRKDDGEDVIKKRLEVFYSQNTLLLDFYKNTHRLVHLDANQPVASLNVELKKYFG